MDTLHSTTLTPFLSPLSEEQESQITFTLAQGVTAQNIVGYNTKNVEGILHLTVTYSAITRSTQRILGILQLIYSMKLIEDTHTTEDRKGILSP